MATLVLNAYSSAYPDIANRIRASIFLQSDPLAIIASQIDSTPGHPIRIWSFPGLPRNNYGFSLDEIDGSGNPVDNLAYFDVVPGEVDGELIRDDEQIQVGTTPGLDAGETTALFDGSEVTTGIFRPDYRGWNIVIDEMTGRDILATDYDYSWDKVTGEFSLLLVGDLFALSQRYNIHFDAIENPQGNSYPTVTDFNINLIITDTTLDTTFFGDKLIVEPNDVFIIVTLPVINTVPQGRKLMVEIGGTTAVCAQFVSQDAPINFLRGTLYAYPNESFSIYRYSRDEVDEWRVCDCDGNFKTVGQSVGDDSVAANVYNKKLMDGSVESTLRYARIFNEIVLNLPLSQVVNFADWGTGNNKYFFSKANGSDQFHFPDRRGIFERNNNVGKAGDFFADQVKEMSSRNPATSTGAAGSNALMYNGNRNTDVDIPIPATIGNTETFPKNYLINKYCLI